MPPFFCGEISAWLRRGQFSFSSFPLIRDERIAAIEENLSDSADHVIDTEGKIVASGFIDIHTHSDFTLPLNPKAEGKIRQGVTTEVIGNCGFSVAPALPEKVEELQAYLSGSAPWLPFEETEFRELHRCLA